MRKELPLIIEPEDLLTHLDDECVVVVDVSIPKSYKDGHVPGALHLKYPSIVHAHDNVDCDVPCNAALSESLSKLGLQPEHHVVAYDAQHNPMAARLIWTLEEIGHHNYSLLNGGWHAWRDGGFPVDKRPNELPESHYIVEKKGMINATRKYIEDKLHQPDVVILDTRMHEEFTNELLITDRGGNIPGAVHFDWLDAIDQHNQYRFVNESDLRKNYAAAGVVPEKEIIVYCQTHFRSAHTYVALRHLGFENLRAYAAGYSEWGNEPDTEIENEVFDEN